LISQYCIDCFDEDVSVGIRRAFNQPKRMGTVVFCGLQDVKRSKGVGDAGLKICQSIYLNTVSGVHEMTSALSGNFSRTGGIYSAGVLRRCKLFREDAMLIVESCRYC